MFIPIKISLVYIFSIVLLLSIVVQVTDSCSSTLGWKNKNVKLDENPSSLPSINDKNHMSKSIRDTGRPTIPSHQPNAPCPQKLHESFCLNGGTCFMAIQEPYCHCSNGFIGYRCEEKSLDGHYNVIASKESSSTSTTPPTTTTTATKTENPEVTFNRNSNLRKMRVLKCSDPYDLDYCLNGGKCILFQQGFNHACICKHPFFGERCEEKGLDGNYSKVLNRTRRRAILMHDSKKKHQVYYRPRSLSFST